MQINRERFTETLSWEHVKSNVGIYQNVSGDTNVFLVTIDSKTTLFVRLGDHARIETADLGWQTESFVKVDKEMHVSFQVRRFK